MIDKQVVEGSSPGTPPIETKEDNPRPGFEQEPEKAQKP